MTDREKVIRAIELEIKHENTWECRKECPYYGKTDCNCFTQVLVDALELLKEQQEERNRMVSWLAKFCVHIDNFPDGIKKSYAEQYDFFKRKMNQQFGWEVD